MTTCRAAVTNTASLPRLTGREPIFKVAEQKPVALAKPFPHKPSDAAGRRRRQ
jgi:hypothetical protein